MLSTLVVLYFSIASSERAFLGEYGGVITMVSKLEPLVSTSNIVFLFPV